MLYKRSQVIRHIHSQTDNILTLFVAKGNDETRENVRLRYKLKRSSRVCVQINPWSTQLRFNMCPPALSHDLHTFWLAKKNYSVDRQLRTTPCGLTQIIFRWSSWIIIPNMWQSKRCKLYMYFVVARWKKALRCWYYTSLLYTVALWSHTVKSAS
jgi:hypothetical protein